MSVTILVVSSGSGAMMVIDLMFLMVSSYSQFAMFLAVAVGSLVICALVRLVHAAMGWPSSWSLFWSVVLM